MRRQQARAGQQHDNKDNSCDRALCECDRQFAIAHASARQVYTNDYHAFWSELGWDPEGQCQKGGNGKGGNPQCCGGGTTAYVSSYIYKWVIMSHQCPFRHFTMPTKKIAAQMEASPRPEPAKNIHDLKTLYFVHQTSIFIKSWCYAKTIHDF